MTEEQLQELYGSMVEGCADAILGPIRRVKTEQLFDEEFDRRCDEAAAALLPPVDMYEAMGKFIDALERAVDEKFKE